MSELPDTKSGFEKEALPHLDAVYRFALRLTGAPDQAEDLVQETFLRAYRSWGQYTQGTRAKSWLFTICRNVFLRRRERAQRHDEIVSETADRSGAGPSLINPVWSRSTTTRFGLMLNKFISTQALPTLLYK